jgi:hypothetical protein
MEAIPIQNTTRLMMTISPSNASPTGSVISGSECTSPVGDNHKPDLSNFHWLKLCFDLYEAFARAGEYAKGNRALFPAFVLDHCIYGRAAT